MKVILLQDIKALGKKGQVVEVADGYARNYLLPRKLAQEATADNINAAKMKEKARLKKLEEEKAQAMAIAEKLKACQVHIRAKAGGAGKLFGSVTSKEIADALQEQCGITIEKNKIVQDEPIKTFGAFEVKCKLGFEITGTINVLVTEG
ncbi:MAG: 50S ribosomal protein L9 [Clostridiales bacterium]|nr:50S ribosomal protein L9 [Clostridiales bacterium]